MLGVTFVLTLETVMKACLAYTRDQNQRYLTNNLSPVDVRVNQPVGVDCSGLACQTGGGRMCCIVK